jgi:hypothetical protein
MKAPHIAICLLALVSCNTPYRGGEGQAIQAAKKVFADAAMQSPNSKQELEALETFKCFPFATQKGWAVVMTMNAEAKIMRLDESGRPLDREWQKFATAASSDPLTNKYQVTRHAKRIWAETGDTNNTPCYAVPIRDGWLAIFGNYCQTFTVLVDTNGVVYDTTWIE